VPPAVTTTTSPASVGAASARSTSSAIWAGSLMRPSPSQPQASQPLSGPTKRTPRSRKMAAFACVAAWRHMFTFIEGATSTGARVASRIVETSSSAMPCAILASRSAVAGATTTTSAQSASAMWSIRPSCSGSKRSLRTDSPESAWSASGATKCAALRVIAQRTTKSALRSARTSSGAFTAAMPPPIARSTWRWP